jgi:cystathionine beta-lyase family protein involved in aluminum resistance
VLAGRLKEEIRIPKFEARNKDQIQISEFSKQEKFMNFVQEQKSCTTCHSGLDPESRKNNRFWTQGLSRIPDPGPGQALIRDSPG